MTKPPLRVLSGDATPIVALGVLFKTGDTTEIRVAEPVVIRAGHQSFEVQAMDVPRVMDLSIDQPMTPELEEIDIPTTGGVLLTDKQKAEFQTHIQVVAKRTCPYCRVYFPTGLKPQHPGSAKCKEAQAALK